VARVHERDYKVQTASGVTESPAVGSGRCQVGQLSNAFSLPQIALGYGGLALVATLFTVIAARNPDTDTTRNIQHGE
jgi:hypothetical protein